MDATYIGTPCDGVTGEVTLFGLVFPKGEAVDISGLEPSERERLAGNGTFLVCGASEDDELADLRGKLDALGVGYHHRNGVVRLRELLAAAKPPAAVVAPPPVVVPVAALAAVSAPVIPQS